MENIDSLYFDVLILLYKKNIIYSLLDPTLKSAQRFSTVTHVVKNQIKCILLNERPRDIPLVTCLDVYPSVNGVLVSYYSRVVTNSNRKFH